jgi:hypothetical protein
LGEKLKISVWEVLYASTTNLTPYKFLFFANRGVWGLVTTRSRVFICDNSVLRAVLITRHVPAGILRRRAAVALMTGCEALLTMYRIGLKA